MTFTKRTTTGSGGIALGGAAALLGLLFVSTIGTGACGPVDRTFDQTGSTGTGGSGGSGGGMVCTPGTDEACYTGPAETLEVGTCKAGTHTCLPSGEGFSECGGEVLPQAENCLTPEDESCSGGSDAMECPALGDGWLKTFGSPGTSQTIQDAAVGPDGNIVVVGGFGGTLDFGNGPMASTGSDDIFVAKFDPLGKPIWAKRFGDVSTQRAYAVGIDSMGGIYVGGNAFGSVDFGDGAKTSTGSDDAFLAKFDADGTVVWSKLFGDTGSQEIRSIVVTKANQVVVAGVFGGTINFGGATLTSAGLDDVFLAKFSSDGFFSASRRFGGTSSDSVRGIALAPNDDIVVTGTFDGTIDMGGPMFTSAGLGDIFVGQYGSTGSMGVKWAHAWGDASLQDGTDVKVATNGDIFLAGAFEGGIDFAGSVLSTPDPAARALYVVRMVPTGDAVVWAKSFGDATALVSNAQLAVDAQTDQLIITGTASGSLDFGGGLLTAVENLDPFFAKLAGDGGHIASRMIPSVPGGGDDGNLNLAVTLLPSGDVIVGGVRRAPFQFGGQTVGAVDPKFGDAYLGRLLH